jgi:very-short-patch-repair endonuclease
MFETLRQFGQNFDELRSYISLSPIGGEGQGEGVVVKERTFEERIERAPRRTFAKRLRRNETDAERKFWWLVRGRQFAGMKFRRQYLIGPYIADFVCLEARLVVELDGGQHAEQMEYDRKRDAFLASKGFRVIRIWNVDFLTNTDDAMDAVFRALSGDTPSP